MPVKCCAEVQFWGACTLAAYSHVTLLLLHYSSETNGILHKMYVAKCICTESASVTQVSTWVKVSSTFTSCNIRDIYTSKISIHIQYENINTYDPNIYVLNILLNSSLTMRYNDETVQRLRLTAADKINWNSQLKVHLRTFLELDTVSHGLHLQQRTHTLYIH